MHAIPSRTGFSREGASPNAHKCAAWHPTPSRPKPVPLNARGQSVGPASAGKRPVQTHKNCAAWQPDAFPAKAGPTKSARSVSGTGFSREEASPDAQKCAAWQPDAFPASAGRGQSRRTKMCSVAPDAFPAKASPTKSARSVSGTGFSREEASSNTHKSAAWHPTHSRLKAVPNNARDP
jgi:hypothetical protein